MKKLELNKEEEERALKIHQEAIFINALDSIMGFHGPQYLLDVFIHKLRKEGVTAVHETISRPCLRWGSNNVYDTVKAIGEWYEILERGSNEILLATTTEDIRKAKKEGKVAIIFGFQHSEPIENDIDLLKVYHRLGVRVMQLTYNEKNLIGDGCDERTDSGLSNLGIQVIEEMNRLGILIDLSHVGYKTTMEAIEISKEPCCFTHSNPRALCDKVRNKTDEQIKALAEKGGVMGLSFFTVLLRLDRLPTITEDYVDNIEYVANLVGVDHVGTGLDIAYGVTVNHPVYKRLLSSSSLATTFAGACYTQQERLKWYMSDKTRWFDITRGLVARGYSDQEIEKILGLNFLRLFRRVWGK